MKQKFSTLQSPNSFFPSSCCNWSCLLFNLLRFGGWVEAAGGIRCCCRIFLSFGFRIVGTLECFLKEHLLFGEGENHRIGSLQLYFSMTYFHLLLPNQLQIAWFVQGAAVEGPATSGSSKQLEVSTAVAGFTLAAMLHPSCFVHSAFITCHNKTVHRRMETNFERWLHETKVLHQQFFAKQLLQLELCLSALQSSSVRRLVLG